MTKDEMKNKISMALKDPILQQSFEIICKENAELKNRNAELNKKLFKAEEEYDKMFWNKNEIIFKAKELLKKLYNETRGYINDQGFDIKILAEVEQFLKETADIREDSTLDGDWVVDEH